MDKEILTTLISRDLDDLRKLVDGFLQLPQCPEPLVQLAADKAEVLSANLLLLLEKQEEPEVETEPEVEIEFLFEPDDEPEEERSEIEEIPEASAPAEEPLPEPEEEPVAEEPTEEETPREEPARRPLFAEQEDKTLGNAFLNRPVEDLKKAISLADRFRFIRELFGGNGELMTTTIDELNALNSFDEVQTYLTTRFPQWDGENAAVVDFINIVSRKF